MTVVSFSDDADKAMAAGDIRRARILLAQQTKLAPTLETWLKLGSMCRADGDFQAALASIEKALAIAPLDFMALLSRASLLERLAVPEFGAAYGRAMAQRPSGALSPTIERMLAHAELSHIQHIEARSARLSRAVSPALKMATASEAKRIARYQSNVLRKTRTYHSEPTHFHFPGLVEQEFYDPADFGWFEAFAAHTDTIAAEFAVVASASRAELVPYVQYSDHEPLDQWRDLNNSSDWTAIHLLQNGLSIEANAKHCPTTMALLNAVPQPKIAGCSPNAMFSLLAPRTTIPPHHGVSNTRLVCHLPLIVPEGCWFRVGAETKMWGRGKPIIFDDTIEHEACNPSNALRVVLIFDVWHPDLSETEQGAVRLLMEADANEAALAL